MKKIMSVGLVFCMCEFLGFAGEPNKQTDSAELSALRQRVEELENQNRKMLQLVIEIQRRLDNASVGVGSTMPSAASLQSSEKVALEPAALHADSKPASPGMQADEAARNKQPVLWSELLDPESRIKFYGFLRVDFDLDSQRPNAAQNPLFILSPDPRGGADAGNFSMHPRLTRFGVDYIGSKVSGLNDGKLSGKMELDFQNGGSESRQIIRIRHAYFKMNWRDFSILGGQTWDTFSPLFPTPNDDTVMWWVGNVGDRRPQFRAAYEPKTEQGQWSFRSSLGLTGAVDPQDLDQDGFRDGEVSRRPNVQARVGYSQKLWARSAASSFGLSGFYGWLETVKPVAGRTDFHIQGLNFDYTLPFSDRVALAGENWWGRNMGDFRGGAGQGIVSGHEVRGRGGWSELKLGLSRYWSVNTGISIDDPVDGDLPNGGRVRNRAVYIANRITPGAKFLIGFDYLRWKTNYKGLQPGIDNRFNLFFQYGY